MKHADKKKSNEFYESSLESYGSDSPLSLGWHDEKSQKLRYDIMTMIGSLDGHSVLDVGCGLGDFYGYFKDKNYRVDYTGYDISEKLIAAAKEKFKDGIFEVKDILIDRIDKKFDFAFAIGPFSVKAEDSLEHLKNMATKMFGLSKKGIGFTALSAYEKKDKRYDIFYYFDPEEVFKFCKSLTPMVTLRHDYLPHDFTIYMYK